MASRQHCFQNGTLHAPPLYNHYSWHKAAWPVPPPSCQLRHHWNRCLLFLVQLLLLLHHFMMLASVAKSAFQLIMGGGGYKVSATDRGPSLLHFSEWGFIWTEYLGPLLLDREKLEEWQYHCSVSVLNCTVFIWIVNYNAPWSSRRFLLAVWQRSPTKDF